MATTSRGPSVGTTPNEGRRDLGAGTSWWPCCSAIWPGRTRCGRSAGDWPRQEGRASAPELGKLVHLGLKKAPPRSPPPYANTHRPWELFETVFYDVPGRCQELASTKRRRFRFNNPLRSLDSTTIDLCAEVFDWATFRRTKGAVKLHLQLDHRGCLPCWALVAEGSRHEVKAAQGVSFAAGTIVALDRGYNDYRLFGRWTEEGVFFVTRAKEGMQYEIIKRRLVPESSDVICDEVIRLTGKGAEERCPQLLRMIEVWDPEQGRFLTFLTNIMHLAAGTVAAIYRERWQIELFFKALRQHLKGKTFVGTRERLRAPLSENAVKTQIWTALISMLLLKYLQLKSSWNWSLSNLAALFRLNLLTYRDLWHWLDDPYETPVEEPGPQQQLLFPI